MRSSSCMVATSWGNLSPFVKELFPYEWGKTFHMAKERIPPRQRLAKNLRVLSKVHELSGHQIGRKAGIDPKTVSNMMRAEFDPRMSMVDKVASVFGLAGWQLLAYDMEKHPPDSAQVARLLEHYSAAEDLGRKAIMQVAEIASNTTP